MKRSLALVLTLLVAAGIGWPDSFEGSGAPHSPGSEGESIPFPVSTQWLSSHLSDKGLVLLHVGDESEYNAEHLPGAQFIRLQDISTPNGSFPPLELPPVSQLREAFEKLGISDTSLVVVYFGKDRVSPAARVILTLQYLGLGGRCSLLDGGMPAWKSAGEPLTQIVKPPPERASLTPRVRQDVVVDMTWVRSRLNQPDVALVDARTSNYYAGESAGSAKRAGHIPGALNIPYSSLVEDSLKLKDSGTMEAIFQQAGVRKGQTVVTYCHIGQSASLVYLIARSLGYEARMYDGSFTEWSANPELPVVK